MRHVTSNLNVTTGIVTSPPPPKPRGPRAAVLPSPWSSPFSPCRTPPHRLPLRLSLLVSCLASRFVSRFSLRISRRLPDDASSLASFASSLASLASSLTSLASSLAVSRRCSFSRQSRRCFFSWRSRRCSSSRRVSVAGFGGVQCALMVAVSLGDYFLHILKNIKPKTKSFLKQNFQSCAPCAPNLPCA